MDVRSKGKPTQLDKPEPLPCLLGIDPETGYLAFARFDVQHTKAVQVWHQRDGWLPAVKWPATVSPEGGWIGYIHDRHYKVVTTDWYTGESILLDLGEVPR